MMSGMKHLTKEEKLKQMELFRLDKRRLSRNLIHTYEHLMGKNKEDKKDKLVSVVPSKMTKSNRHKLK